MNNVCCVCVIRVCFVRCWSSRLTYTKASFGRELEFENKKAILSFCQVGVWIPLQIVFLKTCIFHYQFKVSFWKHVANWVKISMLCYRNTTEIIQANNLCFRKLLRLTSVISYMYVWWVGLKYWLTELRSRSFKSR